MSNEFRQFLLRQTELEKQARNERMAEEARREKRQRENRGKEQKQNPWLSRISILF
ncbi:MAG: hypothetical protein L6Q98_17515 [Anaerolineae bacterium]|nr:hypothetical protein [Anaerolineae bacterium]NUQ05247.1 hypothetical protein [Anaerolineae bacterium]